MKNLKNIFGLRVFKTNTFHIDLFPSENSIIEIKGVSGLGKTSLLKGLMLALMPRKKYQLENQSNLSTVMKLLDKYGTNGKISNNNEIDKTLKEMFCEPQKSYFGFTMNQDTNLYIIMYPKNINRLEFEKLPITILNGDSKDFYNKLNTLLEDKNGNYTQTTALEKLKQDSIIDYGNLLLSDNCDEFWIKTKKDHKLLIVPTKTKEDYESVLLIMLNDIIDSNKIIENFIEMLITQEIKKYNKEQIEEHKTKHNIVESKNVYEGTILLKKSIENYKNNMIFDDEELNSDITKIHSLIIDSQNIIEILKPFNSNVEELRELLNNKENELKELQSQKNDFDIDLKTKIDEFNILKTILNQNISDKDENQEKLNTNYNLIEIYEDKNYDLKNLSETINNLEKEIKELYSEIQDIDSINNNKKEIQRLLKQDEESYLKRKKDIKDNEIKIKNNEIKIENIENSYKNNDLLTNESKQLLNLFDVHPTHKYNIDEINKISLDLLNIDIFKEKLSIMMEKESIESLSKEINDLKNRNKDVEDYEIIGLEKNIQKKKNDIEKLEEKSLKNPKELNIDYENLKIDCENLKRISIFYIDEEKINNDLKNNKKNIIEYNNQMIQYQLSKLALDHYIEKNKINIEQTNNEIDELKTIIEIYNSNELLFLSLKKENDNLIDDVDIYDLKNIDLKDLKDNVDKLKSNKYQLLKLYSMISYKLNKEIDIDLDSNVYLMIEKTNDLLTYFNQQKNALDAIADNLDDSILTTRNIFDSILQEQQTIESKIIKKLKKEYSEIKTVEGGKIELKSFQNDEMISIFKKMINYLDSIINSKQLISETNKIEEFNEVFREEKINKFKNYKTFSENSFLDENGKYIFLNEVKLSFDGSTGNHKIVQSSLRVSVYNKYKDDNSLVLPIIIDEANGADNELLNDFLNNIGDIGYNGTICLIAANGVLQPKHITNVIHLVRKESKVYLIQEDKIFVEEV